MRLIGTTIVTILALCLPAVAEAKPDKYPLPDPRTYEIEEPYSIGGVKLGQSLDRANRRWGGEGKCGRAVLPDSCFWGGFSDDREGRAEVQALDGTVDFVSIAWNGVTENGKPDIRREIARFKTSEGIRLGSKLADVGDAYPNAEAIKHPVSGRVQAYELVKGGSSMIFGGGKFVNYIVINDAD